MDLAYIWLCQEHSIDKTDLQCPMLVSQAVLITPFELSASISISIPNYLDLSLWHCPVLSCKFQIANLPGALYNVLQALHTAFPFKII